MWHPKFKYGLSPIYALLQTSKTIHHLKEKLVTYAYAQKQTLQAI
jgi:hypothetical protein